MFERHNRNLWDNVKLGGIFVFIGGFSGVLTSVILGHFVNCMTGTVTEAGVSFGETHFIEAMLFVTVACSFIFGAFTSTKTLDKHPRGHIKILFREAALLVLVALLAKNHEHVALILAATAMGIQNGMTTYATWTRGKVRSTHVTGTSTDIGVSLATGDYRETGFTIFQAFTYLSGAVIGYYVAISIGEDAFLLVSFVLVLLAMMDIAKNYFERKSII